MCGSALSSRAFITAVVPREGLNWGFAVKRADDMVIAFLSAAFTHSELLARWLAGCVAGFNPTSMCTS